MGPWRASVEAAAMEVWFFVVVFALFRAQLARQVEPKQPKADDPDRENQ